MSNETELVGEGLWSDRSWKNRSGRVCHLCHGLEEGRGDECAAHTPCKGNDTGGVSRPGGTERPLN
jgi:hypothetical protein